jgi:hypothetical protein
MREHLEHSGKHIVSLIEESQTAERSRAAS